MKQKLLLSSISLILASSLHAADVHVGVVYGPHARSALGGYNSARSKILNGLNDARKSFKSSGTKVSLKLGNMGYMPNFKPKGNNTQNHFSHFLSNWKNEPLYPLKSRGPKWKSRTKGISWVKARNLDLIMAVTNTNSGGDGVAQLPGPASIVSARKLVPSHHYKVVAHELGHCINAQHGKGYYINGGQNGGTVMTTYPDYQWFANPKKKRYGKVSGTKSKNNALKILNRRHTAGTQNNRW